jgi:hypothetical protein
MELPGPSNAACKYCSYHVDCRVAKCTKYGGIVGEEGGFVNGTMLQVDVMFIAQYPVGLRDELYGLVP